NLTIVSNGGDGSKGQDGINGKNGEDGKGITELEFKNKFPPVANLFKHKRAENLEKTLNEVEANWQIKEEKRSGKNIYLAAINQEGNEIEFCYYNGGFLKKRQAYLLYKGSPG